MKQPFLSSIHRCGNSVQNKMCLCCLRKTKSRVFFTKILIYKAVVLPTLLYVSKTWVTYRRHIKALEQFQQRTLRAILGVCWQDQTTNASILEQACTTSIEARLVKTQLCWAGHAKRIPDTREQKQLLCTVQRQT